MSDVHAWNCRSVLGGSSASDCDCLVSKKADYAAMTHPPEPLSATDAIQFLLDAAKYFRKCNTGGEDKAHWSNVYNSENCVKAASLVATQVATISTITAERDAALANARTPGTHEICQRGPDRCTDYWEYQWGDCEQKDCPIRAKVTPCGD